MANEFKITPTRQYNIDAIKNIRLELDISGGELSLEISPTQNRTFVGSIESAGNNAAYTDNMMNQIAIYFTKIAKKRQAELDEIPDNTIKLKTDYTIYDFYPKKPLSEVLQIKTNSLIPRDAGPTATLNGLIETGFFDTQRSLKDVVNEANKAQDQTWGTSDFTAILQRAKDRGKLVFIHQPDDTVRYVKG